MYGKALCPDIVPGVLNGFVISNTMDISCSL